MARNRYRALTAADVAAIPPCPACGATGWSSDAPWVRAAMREHGSCGVGAFDGDRLVGHLLLAPGRHLPPGLPTHAGQQGAALVVGLRVVDEYSRAGIGRGLLQSAAARLPVQHLDAIAGLGVDCQHPPVAWLEGCGFRPYRRVGSGMVWRLDVDGAVRWRELTSSALARLGGLLPRPVVAPPEPATRLAA